MKEPQSIDDPAANVFLTVSRSEGGKGEVRLIWILEEAAKYDLTPLNGTLLFAEVNLLFSSISLFSLMLVYPSTSLSEGHGTEENNLLYEVLNMPKYT